jgi:Flp pilus assembly protein TadD
MRLGSFFALLILAYSIAFPRLSQASPSNQNSQRRVYSISGRVNDDANEQGIDNVRVNLQSDGLVLDSVYSRDGGNFEFDGVAPGGYTITVQLDGYDSYRATVTVSRAPVVSFAVELTKSLPVSRTNARGTISVHQLGVPRKAREAFEKGIALMRSEGDYEGALAEFQNAIKTFPAYYEAYAMEGVAYISLKDTSSAETAERKSIELSSGHYPDAFFVLASLLTEAEKYSEAETAARSAAALNASSWAAHYELAHALYFLHRSEEAEPEATRARELYPQNPKITLLLANIHLDRRNYSAMLQDIDTYLKLDPTGPQADQVRKDRDQVLQALQKTPSQRPADHVDQ